MLNRNITCRESCTNPETVQLNYFKAETAIVKDAQIGGDTKIWHYANVYGCKIGNNCTVGSYTEIQNDVLM